MSILKKLSNSQDVAVVLFENESTTSKFDMNINTISITNLGSVSVVVDLHISPNSGSDHTVMAADIPGGVTLVYDTEFSFAFDSKLRITPNNNNELNIIIN